MSIKYFFQKHEKNPTSPKPLNYKVYHYRGKTGSSNIFAKVLSIKIRKSMFNMQSTRHCCNKRFF